ncbi:hypothetical protein [Rhodococcus erythropolis]|uniref:hypothetical protein n=1 Tax=Rhodococcus erythropolis TaxID=1833 RepID=UPI001BEACC81|nr:hypothetical protein [Rhodococcus erythropolis]MBT2269607.1 hypothetical protein [Rhodococcus erythropolis]
MSRSRMAVAALLLPVAAGAVALVGAGAASAATPYSGNGYVGVTFDQNETRFIADTNAGELLRGIPDNTLHINLGPGSIYQGSDNVVYATVDQLVDESASHGGRVALTISDPAIWNGVVLTGFQQW